MPQKEKNAIIVFKIGGISDGNPNTNKASAITFFREMASLYKDYDNVIYEICNEPNGDVQWVRDIKYALHFYAGTHKEYLRQKLLTALNTELPIFVTEFGISDASGNGVLNINEGNTWIDFLNTNNISWMCWNLSNKDESSSLLRNTNKVTGWTREELSNEGKWLLEALKR